MKPIHLIATLALCSILMARNITDDKTYTFTPEKPVTASVEAGNDLSGEGLGGKIVPCRITCYLWTGNPMANGLYPKRGYVATSDRKIPFGVKVEIDGVEYEVGDRTNARFQDFEIPTIDIFWEDDLESCLEFGTKYKNVIIK